MTPKLSSNCSSAGSTLQSSTGSYATHLPSLNLTMLPFLVENYEQGWKFYDESKWLKQQFALAPAKGFRFLATSEAGFRNIYDEGAADDAGRCPRQEAALVSQ
jgi:TRAP-type C4-dicarboxylate transport system substrate-binding protein